METALTDPRKTEINEDFRVSTALFRTHFETRVFSTTDYIPAALVKRLEENVKALTLLDKHFPSEDTGERYDDVSQDYEECVTGYAVETYGFSDANATHDVIVATIQGFVRDYTRVVKYV